MVKTAGSEMCPVNVKAKNAPAHSNCTTTLPCMMRIREMRSAAAPATRKSRKKGANWARPTKPRCSGFPVSS